MPAFDLRGIKVARYTLSENKEAVYSEKTSVGDAMNVNLSWRFAEGRLYAESSLAEYMRKCTGGTISIGVKYLPLDAQKLMYGDKEKTRTISYTPASTSQGSAQPTTKQIKSQVTGGVSLPSYVGTSFYAPDMIDGVQKFTAVFVSRSLFGKPDMVFQTAGENIVFNTPTTTGEFLNNGTKDQDMVEVAILDSEEEAIAWTDLVLTSPEQTSG